MGDRMIALLRTAVPVLYGHVAAFLVFLGAPEQLVTDYRGLLGEGIAVVLSVAWWGLWTWLGPYLPDGLVALVLGHPGQLSYGLRDVVDQGREIAVS